MDEVVTQHMLNHHTLSQARYPTHATTVYNPNYVPTQANPLSIYQDNASQEPLRRLYQQTSFLNATANRSRPFPLHNPVRPSR